MMFFRLSLACFALSASPLLTEAQQLPSVTIERVAHKQWRATYRLTSPTKSLRFTRPAGFYRERVWRVVTPGYRMTRFDDAQTIMLDSNAAPAREIVVEFAEFTDPLPKEYELFQPFSDGSIAIYTGHFHTVATGASRGETTQTNTIRILPRAGEHMIAQGRIRTGVLTDSSDNGTYVYIGTVEPIPTDDVIAVIDPGIPAWLKQSFHDHLPALFNEYASRLGVVLPVKPVVYFSFNESGSGRSSGGGTLDGLINMTLSGNDWRLQTPGALEQAFALIAHESAHMWNGQLVTNADDGPGSWMHEGSADAMANEMLLRFGVIDSSRYRARRESALNSCVTAVAAGSVETALRRGSIQVVYDCGFVMTMWADALAQRSNPAANFFTLWRTLIAAVRVSGSYDAHKYYAALSSLGIPDSAIGRMRAFVASTDSASVLLAGLRSAGLTVTASEGSPPLSYQQNLARSAMLHLMQQACNRASFSWGEPIRTDAIPTCAPFARQLGVYRIHNLRVRDEGALLYDAVRSACAAGESVMLNDQDGTVVGTVPCTKPLQSRIPWLRLGSQNSLRHMRRASAPTALT